MGDHGVVCSRRSSVLINGTKNLMRFYRCATWRAEAGVRGDGTIHPRLEMDINPIIE